MEAIFMLQQTATFTIVTGAQRGSVLNSKIWHTSKAQVDAVGHKIDKQRKRPPKPYILAVPSEAIDHCENAYEAADGKKQKAVVDSFDATSVMALICCHDIPLYFANINTFGEQQKYAVALLELLFSLIPPQATVAALYHVGCVLNWLLAQNMLLRAFALQQLLCMCMGTSGHVSLSITLQQQHLWLIDCQAAAIGQEMQSELGDWIKRHLKQGIAEQGSAAQAILDECGIPVSELRAQWSNHSYAPGRLKKKLGIVLALQAKLDMSDKALQSTRVVIEKCTSSADTLEALESLERGHKWLMNKVDILYASRKVHNKFLELKGIDLEFVCTLLMA
ncbi:hypothetical protein SERLA73DRAFT_163496 [Serpula lacrymans var. lacrymans S7.3]|uniref:Uncharacterized protein n=1 Tax=Serpula lacrymans var. lacrymans (strain S7.3) TaxID=936435 RepID=F8QDX8_SERL3|nr:hypothetical protein SERLA73DRAFT_163496 [Serpula lacrymans var. lacrymans S7.3]